MNIVILETTARKAQIGRWPRISNPFQIIKPITFVTFLTYLAYYIGPWFPTFRTIFDVGGNVRNIHFQIQWNQRRRRIWIFYGQNILACIHSLVVRTGQTILHLFKLSFDRRNILFARFLIVPLGKAILFFLERVFITIFLRAWIMLHIAHLPAYRERALVGIFYNFFRDHGILYFREAKIRLFEIRVVRVSPHIGYFRLRRFRCGLLTDRFVVHTFRRRHLGGGVAISRHIRGTRGERVRVRINIYVRARRGAYRIFHFYV